MLFTLSALSSLNGKCPFIVSLIAVTSITVSSSSSTTNLFGFPPMRSCPATTSIVLSTRVIKTYSNFSYSQRGRISSAVDLTSQLRSGARIVRPVHCPVIAFISNLEQLREASRFFRFQNEDLELSLRY